MAETVATQGTWEEAVAWLRAQPGQDELVRAAYFDDPADAACARYWQSNEWQAVRALLGRGPGKALDVGAGRGIASYALARDGYSVTALEPDPSALVGAAAIRGIAARNQLDITVVDTLTQPLSFADASFDVIFARAVLHHIPDLNQAMRELHRVLKPGGTLLAVREHVLSRDEDLPAFFDLHPLHHRYGGEMAYRLPVYVAAIEQAGFRIDKLFGSLESPINYGPQSRAELARGIGRQLTRGLPVLSQGAALAIQLPGLGDALLKIATGIDNRPGRHYSFLARRPA